MRNLWVPFEDSDNNKKEDRSAMPKENYTLLFGCDPLLGVSANTKFVDEFIKNLKSSFESKHGTLKIPECLGYIEQN